MDVNTAKKILIMSDSMLLVGQSIKEFKARKESLKRYQEEYRRRMIDFDEVTF